MALNYKKWVKGSNSWPLSTFYFIDITMFTQ